MSEKNQEAAKIELRSSEVQEILARPPHQLIRYGTTLICSIIAILIAGSFFFSYPDIVSGDVVITTENPPVWIVAKSTGFIKELNCTDKQEINQGDILAVIENPASTKDIRQLTDEISSIIINDSVVKVSEEIMLLNLDLGEIQTSYSAFIQKFTDYRNFIRSNLIEQEKKLIEAQISSRKSFISNLKKQIAIKQDENKIAQTNYQREKKLYAQKVISEYDMEQAEQSYLSAKQDLQQLQTSLAQENVVSSELSASYQKLSVQYEKEQYEQISALRSSLLSLKTEIYTWEQNYVLRAPVSGKVTFNTIWKVNQNVAAGDNVFAVIPDAAGHIIAKVQLPLSGSGKVKPDQQVNIKIDGYPYLEYGLIQGKTTNISLIPDDKYYMAEVEIPNGLITTNQKQLHFTGELTGNAEVITEKRALIERIFSPIRYILTYLR